MSFLSLLRDVSYLARDILPALKRFTSPQPDDTARHMADVLADKEAEEEVSEPQESPEWVGDVLQACDEFNKKNAREMLWPGSEQPLISDAHPECAAVLEVFNDRLIAIELQLSQLTSAAPVTVPTDDAAGGPPPQTPDPCGGGHLNLTAEEIVQVRVLLADWRHR